MKKLHEEFKLYENLWEEAEAPATNDPYAEFNLSSSVEEALENYPWDFEIEYDGFTDNWEEDSWDYERHEYTSIPRSKSYRDFTYEVSPEELWEVLRDLIIDQYIYKPGYIEQAIKHYKSGFGSWAQDSAEAAAEDLRKVVADYQKFQELWKTDETAGDKLDIYIADHLDDFFALFYQPIQERYKKSARESQY